MKSKLKKFLILVAAFVGGVIFIGSSVSQNQSTGVPDPLGGSWGQINQMVARPADWKQIVRDKSAFQWGGIADKPYDTYIYNSGCSYRYRMDYYDLDMGTYPVIDGSTVLVPMATEFAWQFLDLDDDSTRKFINFSTTSGAYHSLAFNNHEAQATIPYYGTGKNGRVRNKTYRYSSRVDIVLATYPSVEQLKFAEDRGIEWIIEPVCYDSFVFITHRDNPIDSLTVEQVRQIYSGAITNWYELGGNDEEIIAYQREPDSGSQTAMEEMVMDGIDMMEAPTAQVVAGMGRLVDVIAGYENGPESIGYTYKYYVDRLYTDPNIKILKINDIMPSDENVRNQSYPFIASYNAVIRSDDIDNVGGRFMNWMLSNEGQECIMQAGYVTLHEINK